MAVDENDPVVEGFEHFARQAGLEGPDLYKELFELFKIGYRFGSLVEKNAIQRHTDERDNLFRRAGEIAKYLADKGELDKPDMLPFEQLPHYPK